MHEFIHWNGDLSEMKRGLRAMRLRSVTGTCEMHQKDQDSWRPAEVVIH